MKFFIQIVQVSQNVSFCLIVYDETSTVIPGGEIEKKVLFTSYCFLRQSDRPYTVTIDLFLKIQVWNILVLFSKVILVSPGIGRKPPISCFVKTWGLVTGCVVVLLLAGILRHQWLRTPILETCWKVVDFQVCKGEKNPWTTLISAVKLRTSGILWGKRGGQPIFTSIFTAHGALVYRRRVVLNILNK